MIQTRNDRMDYLKGMRMLGVILGHVITTLKVGSTLCVDNAHAWSDV